MGSEKFRETCETLRDNGGVCREVKCLDCPGFKAYNGDVPCYHSWWASKDPIVSPHRPDRVVRNSAIKWLEDHPVAQSTHHFDGMGDFIEDIEPPSAPVVSKVLVDISLEEYERMENQIIDLQKQLEVTSKSKNYQKKEAKKARRALREYEKNAKEDMVRWLCCEIDGDELPSGTAEFISTKKVEEREAVLKASYRKDIEHLNEKIRRLRSEYHSAIYREREARELMTRIHEKLGEGLAR